MLSIPEILAFYGDGRKPPAAVAVPLDELRALVAECERLRGEKAERAARREGRAGGAAHSRRPQLPARLSPIGRSRIMARKPREAGELTPLPFTAVERDIMRLVADGLTAREIAARLRYSVPYVHELMQSAGSKIDGPGQPRDRILVFVTRWAA